MLFPMLPTVLLDLLFAQIFYMNMPSSNLVDIWNYFLLGINETFWEILRINL